MMQEVILKSKIILHLMLFKILKKNQNQLFMRREKYKGECRNCYLLRI